MAHLAGLLMGSGLVMACSKGIVVERWYEPAQTITYQTTYARMMRLNHIAHEIDDEDFCIAFKKLYRRDLSRLDTLYLPYKDWQHVRVGDTLRLQRKLYSDRPPTRWRIN